MPEEHIATITFPVREGVKVDQFLILEKLAAGGMGVVYKAQDLQLKRLVAVKFMHNQGEGTQRLGRFLREQTVTARLLHPHIVKIFHVGVYKEFPYFAMEYIDGKPIHNYVTENRPPLANIVEMVEKIALALDYAHGCGVVHRDIKPSNIMVRGNGEPVLMDFGVAKSSKVDNRALTRSGEVIGTPEYMSPEQARGLRRESDSSSDLYGLGALFYHLLTGVPPVQGENIIEKLYKVIEISPVPPRKLCPEIPVALEQMCLKAMEKKKKNRYASGQAFAADLHKYRHGQKTTAACFYVRKRLWYWGRAAVAILLLVLLSGWIWQTWPLKPGGRKTSAEPPDYSAQIKVHYNVARSKLQQSAQEAHLYLQKVAQMIGQLDNEQQKNNRALQEIMHNLPYDLLQAAYAAGDYAQACRYGQRLLTQLGDTAPLSVLWQTASAAYHSGLREETQRYLQIIEEKLAADHQLSGQEKVYYTSGVHYCRGLLCFTDNQFAPACERFAEARRLWQGELPDFAPSLHLHYCASMLVDLDAALSQQELQALRQCWQSLEGNTPAVLEKLPKLFYLETEARYLLRMAAMENGDARRYKLEEVFGLLAALWDEGPPLAVCYYMRGKAHLLSEKYTEAEQDFKIAYELDHRQIRALLAKLDLIWRAGDLAALYRYAVEEPIYTHSNKVSVLAMFSDEWHTQPRDHPTSRTGIPFSDATFAEYYNNLSDPSPDVQQIAETAIMAMLPCRNTLVALQQARTGESRPAVYRKNNELVAAIEKKEMAQRRYEFLKALGRVAMQGKIFGLEKFQREYLTFLQQTLAADSDLCRRFLAARVLAHIPSREVRLYLENHYLQGGEGKARNSIATVLAAHALQETGYEHSLVAEEWVERIALRLPERGALVFSEDKAQEEFVQTLLAELLLRQQPAAWKILAWQLTFGSARVRLAAASRFYRPQEMTRRQPDTLARLMQNLHEGIAGRDAANRCFTLRLLSRYVQSTDLECQLQWQQLVQQQFLSPATLENLCRHFTNGTLDEQNAFLHFWHEVALLPAMRAQKESAQKICQLIRPCWENVDPIVRCQSISTSTILGDQEVYEYILFSPQQGLGEKLGVILSLLKVGSYNSAAHKQLLAVLPKVLAKTNQDATGLRIRALLLYLFGMFGDDSLLWLVPTFTQALDDASPLVRCAGISALAHMPHLSAKTWQKIKRMSSDDPAQYARYLAMGLVLHQALRNNMPELEALHQSLKQAVLPNLPEPPQVIAAWGYTLPWDRVVAPQAMIMRRVEWKAEELLEYGRQVFLDYAKDPVRRRTNQVIVRLEKIHDLLGDHILEDSHQETAYGLASLYAMDGRRQDALTLLRDMMRRLGTQDRHFTHLWTRLMQQDGHGEEAKVYLQQKQSELQVLPPQADMISLRTRTRYRALLLRSQAFLEMQSQTLSPQLGDLLQEQYLLYPELPSSLAMWGEYHYRQQNYERSSHVFQELQARLPQDSVFSIWLARINAQRRNTEEVVACLLLACCQNRYLRPNDLEEYPELRPFLARPEVQAIWQKK
jgi:serine/threonine protein kinase